MISVEEATQLVLGLAHPLPTEIVALENATGRYMPKAAEARRDQPPFDASAMDGYAIGGDAPAGTEFAVIGEAGAGHGFSGSMGNGQAVRIFTGAPVPAGTARVVLQEDVTRTGDRVVLTLAARGPTHIRAQGNDFRAGETVSPRLIRANDAALLAAMNVAELSVTRRPVVALIATGDELVMPGQDPSPDQIVCSNTFALKALIEAERGIARMLPIARDTESDLRTVLTMAMDADLIVTVGGASVGDHDLVGQVAGDMGLERAFYRIAMRPGKPLMAGRLQGRAMLGLPGNPVSAIVCGHLFLLPMIRAMLGRPDPLPLERRAVLGSDMGPTGPRTHYMRAMLRESDALPVITAFDDQDSALLGVLAKARALLIRPLGDGPRKAGEVVRYLPL
jgi:molybdopterin molybdotransferase